MHSGPNWTRKRTFKPDDEAQITTESEERQAVHHANWCGMTILCHLLRRREVSTSFREGTEQTTSPSAASRPQNNSRLFIYGLQVVLPQRGNEL